MTNYTKANKTWWDKVTPIHSSSKIYNLKEFKKGKSSLFHIETKELGNVKGKTMLHLMCHFGMDSLSWARKGALVTGIDVSEQSIKLATKLSKEIHTPATFIESDVYNLQKKLHKQFDIVFTSYGVLLWLSNLKKWGELIAKYLKRGGVFYISELHPFTNIFNPEMKMAYDYFDDSVLFDDTSGTYTDWNIPLKGVTYEWNHTLADVINALTSAGLTIEYVHEFPFSVYEQFPGLMKKNKKGEYYFKNTKWQIPLVFSLKARK